jgi:hypothetical protein
MPLFIVVAAIKTFTVHWPHAALRVSPDVASYTPTPNTMANPATINAFKDLVLKTDKIMKAQKKINPRFDLEISSSLPLAIKDKDGPKIELYLTTLKATLKDIENSLDDTRSALIKLGDIERDDEQFVSEHLQDLDKLTTKISDAQSSLTKQFQDGKKFQEQAEKALTALQGTVDKAYQELAELTKWVNDETKDLKDTFQKFDQIATKAQAAFDARDAKALADAQKAMDALEIGVKGVTFNSNESELKDFIQKINGSGYGADDIAELKKGAQDALSAHVGAKVYLEQMGKQEKLVQDFKLEPINVKKALDTLDLDPKVESKLAKALVGTRSVMEKNLDALARELKLKTNGKQMLAALEKAGLI